jgi:hypothetical protein
MQAIRKIQTVENGELRVQLPPQFWGQQVEIIVLSTPQQEQEGHPRKPSLRGCLHHYANPSLISREHKAWQDAVSDKYSDD